MGTNQGIPCYTIGQRKGLGIALGYPVYVVDIIPEKNAVVLGREEDVYSRGRYSGNNNFILIEEIIKPMEVQAKIRYNAEPVPSVIYPEGADTVRVVFDEPPKAVAPGQAVVFYLEGLVVGGGTITEKF